MFPPPPGSHDVMAWESGSNLGREQSAMKGEELQPGEVEEGEELKREATREWSAPCDLQKVKVSV